MNLTRRGFLTRASVGVLATSSVCAPRASAQAGCRRVSGSGSYLLGPFEHAQVRGQQTFLLTDLGFDETQVWCKVTTNFEPFLFPTAKLGVAALGAHEFFMDMRRFLANGRHLPAT
mgnify:CR=1 FL=1